MDNDKVIPLNIQAVSYHCDEPMVIEYPEGEVVDAVPPVEDAELDHDEFPEANIEG